MCAVMLGCALAYLAWFVHMQHVCHEAWPVWLDVCACKDCARLVGMCGINVALASSIPGGVGPIGNKLWVGTGFAVAKSMPGGRPSRVGGVYVLVV